MKKVYNLVAAITLSLLTVGAVAQSTNGQIKSKLTNHRTAKISMNAGHKAHKPTATTTYAFLDTPLSDSVYNSQFAGTTYLGSPSIGQFYIQQMNMHYTMSDTGADVNGQPVNNFLMHWCAVSFDTLLDAGSGNGYLGQNVVVDSLFIPIGQGNTSGKMDTLIVSINSVSATGVPTTTVLWSQTIIQDTGLSGKSTPWNYGTTLQLAPNLTLIGTSKFAVELKYYDETKLDTCGFLFGSPGYNCAALGGNIPDTTKIGKYIPITGGGHVLANSFTNGYSYYTGAKPAATNKPITLPSATYGGAFYFPCTPDTTIGLDWQDIAVYAEVSFTDVTGINNITNNGLSVGQNFPNPYNQSTKISYSLTKSSDVAFSVCDITGRELINNSYNNAAPGQHVISLNANEFTPGIYFYTFKVNGNAVTKKMVITE